MSSPSQRRGSCGHMMAGFDLHGVCARCRDKKKGKDPCVEKPEADCPICNSFTPEQLTQLSTPTYKNKKEKREQKSSTPAKNPSDVALSPTLVDPSLVTVMGVVDGQPASGPSDLSEKPAERKRRKRIRKSPAPSRSNRTSRSSHLTGPLQSLPTRNWRSWSKNGRTGLTGWRHFYWPKLWTGSLLSVLSRLHRHMLHRPLLSALSPSSNHLANPLHPHSHRLLLCHRPPAPLLVCLLPRPDLTLLSLPTDQGLQRQPTNLLRGRSLLPLILEGIPRPVIRTLKVLVQIDLLLICTRKRVNFLTTRKCH